MLGKVTARQENKQKWDEVKEETLLTTLGKMLEGNEYKGIQEMHFTAEGEKDYHLFNNWVDIEGMDYGWLWLNCEDENKDVGKVLGEYIKEKVSELVSLEYSVNDNPQTLIYINKEEGKGITNLYISRTQIEEDIYYSEPEDEDRFAIKRKDIVVRVSNSECDLVF